VHATAHFIADAPLRTSPIRAPGKVLGNISTPSLVIHEGVVFEGQCTMAGTEAGRADRDRKVAFFPKDERPQEAVAFKVQSELAK